jgi:Uma2 family endonuclease
VVAVPEVVVQRRLTLADYEALPDDADYEIIDGVLFVAPSARPRHQVVAAKFTAALVAWTERVGQGTVVPEADLVIDDRNTYISPDIMVFAGDQFSQVDPDEMIRIVPDLVVEVLSPSTDQRDLVVKRDLFERLGARHYWVADAKAKTLRAHALGEDGRYVERVYAAVFEPEHFPGLTIDLSRVFG